MNVNKYNMRKIFTILSALVFTTSFSQVYDGLADTKISFGPSFQSNGIGVFGAYDYGLNDLFSAGVSFGVIVQNDYPEITDTDSFGNSIEYESSDKFLETIDFNVRLNMHFNQLLDLGYNFDFFAGPNLGKNFGAQAGVRYLVGENFGFFAETNIPIATNIINLSDSEVNLYKFYEQPVFSVGIIISRN